MSLKSDRALLAQTLDAVPDITGYDDDPPNWSVGDAAVRWAGLEAQRTPGLFIVTWNIVVVTGATPQNSMMWLDAHLESILSVLDGVVYIEDVRPVQILESLVGIEITATKES